MLRLLRDAWGRTQEERGALEILRAQSMGQAHATAEKGIQHITHASSRSAVCVERGQKYLMGEKPCER